MFRPTAASGRPEAWPWYLVAPAAETGVTATDVGFLTMAWAVAAITSAVAALLLWRLQWRRRHVLAEVQSLVAQRTAELAAANARLQASEARANGFFELGLVGLAELSPDGAIQRCNAEFAKLLGCAPGQLLGRRLATLASPEAAGELAAVFTRLADPAAGADRSMFLQPMRAADGSTVQTHLGLRVATNGDGRIDHILVVMTDMTETVALVDHLLQAKDEANAAARAKSEFLANMSHEIRTPMNAILGYAELLQDVPHAPEVANALEVIQRNGKHLLVILDDILDVSKLEAGRMTIEPVDCELATLLDDVVGLLRGRATAKGLLLEVVATTPVPRRVVTDPTRLRQVLTNLVGNAIKFTERGSVRLLVAYRAQPRAQLQIEVKDTGIGMTQPQLDVLFQPFTQADTSVTRRFGGTGLGLAISQRLAGLLGGGITVSSRVGVGTTFTVTIAAGHATGTTMITELTPGSSRDAARDGKASPPLPTSPAGARVLVAEDGPDNQRLFRAVLAKAGYEFELVGDGEAAVAAVADAAAAGRPFDVVVMDMQMPRLDGYGAVQQLRQRGLAVPVIACTAHAMADDRQKCLDAGCDDFTKKPIDRRELLGKLQQWARPAAPR